MAAVLNRTTKQYLPSVNTPDYPTAQWIINPDLSAVVGFSSRYWIITGDVVTLMNQAQRDALDAQLLAASRDATVNSIDAVGSFDRAQTQALQQELNSVTAKLNAILDAIDGAGTFAAMKPAIAAIADYPQRTLAQWKTQIRARMED